MDAKMYGAFWCSHCYDQKQAFGKEAYARINYIECAPDGVNSQTKLCKSRKARTCVPTRLCRRPPLRYTPKTPHHPRN